VLAGQRKPETGKKRQSVSGWSQRKPEELAGRDIPRWARLCFAELL
ncbi:hypothetical protein A2U01_0015600, partial [Trifolium medium]|nr:hypothetical protein [Trifolium medium]